MAGHSCSLPPGRAAASPSEGSLCRSPSIPESKSWPREDRSSFGERRLVWIMFIIQADARARARPPKGGACRESVRPRGTRMGRRSFGPPVAAAATA
jgi:hypothetical protein